MGVVSRLLVVCGLIGWGFPPAVSAAPPTIARLSLRGLQAGGATQVIVTGAGLLPEPRLDLGLPITKQAVVGPAADNRVVFDVTLPADVVPGVYNLRLVNAQGVTLPEIVAVDTLPQREPAAEPAELPVALTINVAGSGSVPVSFVGRRGETIVVDAMSKRLGSRVRPVIHLYDAERRQLAWSLPQTILAGDARLSATLPSDGTYTVTVHDSLYAAAAPGHIRLAIGAFAWGDVPFPPVVPAQGEARVEVLGQFATGESAVVNLPGGAPRTPGAWLPLPWPGGSMPPVGLRPRVLVSDLREVVEGDLDPQTRQLPGWPISISGRLTDAEEEDLYRFEVDEGDKLRCELFADRLGSPLDAALTLRDAKGAVLATNDDAVGPDPRVEATIAANVAAVEVVVRNVQGRGDARSFYRLVISRQADVPERPDFVLKATEDTLNLAPGGRRVFRVEAERFGYDGPIELRVEGLPKGFASSPVTIPPRGRGALVQVERREAQASGEVYSLTIRGRGSDAKPPLERIATTLVHPLGNLQPWLKESVVLAAAGQGEPPLTLSWGEVQDEANLYSGRDATLPLVVSRGRGVVDLVRLSLVTSQPPVLVNNQPNANAMLRGLTPTVDVAVAPEVKTAFDAMTRAKQALAEAQKRAEGASSDDDPLRAAVDKAREGATKAEEALHAAEEKAKKTVDVPITVPVDLALVPHDLAIRAELRTADNRVLGEFMTPAWRWNVVAPVVIDLPAADCLEVSLEPRAGGTLKLAGTLERRGGHDGDVNLTVTGLPPGVALARPVVVKAEESKFELELRWPPNVAGDRFDTLKLVASGPSDKRRANVLVTAEQPLIVTVKRPPPETKETSPQ